MYQILIVDDDPLLRSAMVSKLDYVNQAGSLDLAPPLTAGTAPEALAILREKPVDILITDIQMPYQSGLELLETVHSEFPLIQLVVLSGYSYYDYMRSAILTGVNDYLLKPVKLIQLQEIMQKCIDNIRSVHSSDKAALAQQQAVLNYQTGKYCNALLVGSPVSEPPSGLTKPYLFAVLFSSGQPDCSDDRLLELLGQFTQHRAQEDGPIFRYFHDINQTRVLLLNSNGDENSLRPYLEDFCAFAAKNGLPCRCGISRAGTSLQRFPTLHHQAGQALSYQIIQDFTVKAAADIPEEPERSPAGLFHKFSRKIQAAFQSRNFGQIYAALNEIFTPDFVSAHQAGLADIRDFYQYFDNQVRELATALRVDPGRTKYFAQFTSLDELRNHLQSLVYLLQQQSEKETDKTQYVISRAIRYMEQHYNQDISMKDVASAVNMSYTYFSKFFKEQAHQSFSEYLTSIRMREAKRLMEEDPSIKVKDVAHLVGYESVYSFSRAFKQYYKVSPTNH